MMHLLHKIPPAFLYLWDMGTAGCQKFPLKIAGSARFFAVFACALTAGATLSACTDPQTAGGGPSGTDAGNAITAQIISEGKPAAQVTVRLIESESLEANSVHTANTDSKGNVLFENIPNGEYILEATAGDMAFQKEIIIDGEDIDLKNASLEKTVSVSGSVQEKTGIIKVRGLAHEASVVDGKFTLDSLPAGPLSLVFIPSDEKIDTSCTYMKVVAGETSTASTFAEESRSLLLDDFQDSNYQNRFMPARTYDGGWWYFDFSKQNVTPEFITTKDTLHRFLLENDNGNIVAHVAAKFGDPIKDSTNKTTIWPWATVGIELGKSKKTLCNDISSVDSVAFRAKGTGTIIFGAIDETQDIDNRIIAEYKFNLTETWKKTTISLADILDDRFSYTCVNQLVWRFKANNDERVDFWLDDIELIGGKRLSIWKK